MRTAKTASLKLPERARESFLAAWKSADCLDLYEGRIEGYLGVIKDVMQRRKLQIEKITKVVDDARKILEGERL